MRPFPGVVAEGAALALLLASGPAVPRGPPFALYVITMQLLSTYLIHCPAHYAVGYLAGIKFREMRLGRTSLARSLPPEIGKLVGLLPVLTLLTDRRSVSQASRGAAAAMYAAGTIFSVGSALSIAAAASLSEPVGYSVFAWAVALVYLSFDLIFSPLSGDLKNARRALQEPPNAGAGSLRENPSRRARVFLS